MASLDTETQAQLASLPWLHHELWTEIFCHVDVRKLLQLLRGRPKQSSKPRQVSLGAQRLKSIFTTLPTVIVKLHTIPSIMGKDTGVALRLVNLEELLGPINHIKNLLLTPEDSAGLHRYRQTTFIHFFPTIRHVYLRGFSLGHPYCFHAGGCCGSIGTQHLQTMTLLTCQIEIKEEKLIRSEYKNTMTFIITQPAVVVEIFKLQRDVLQCDEAGRLTKISNQLVTEGFKKENDVLSAENVLRYAAVRRAETPPLDLAQKKKKLH